MFPKALALAGLLVFSGALRADSDPFAGWTPQQLKVKVMQLQKENQALKDKLAASGGSAQAQAPAQAVTGDTLLDDFEADVAKNGQGWWAGCDDNKVGTTLEPQPFVAEKGGSSASPGHSGRIHGKLGPSQEPWPWASMALALENQDLRGYSAVSFWAKGDGQRYTIQLCKLGVKDFAHYQAQFTAPKEWTKVSIPFSQFAQPEWGAAVGKSFEDVEKIQLNPTEGSKPYDFSIDDLTLVK